jgi:hypothetical protein
MDVMQQQIACYLASTPFIESEAPQIDADSARRAGALLVELDGTSDAMLHPVDPLGHPYIEYIRDRGSYADLPLDEIHRTFAQIYGGHE